MKIRLFKLRIQTKKRNQFTDLTVNAWYDSLSAPFGVFSPGAPASSDTDTGFERDLKVHSVSSKEYSIVLIFFWY